MLQNLINKNSKKKLANYSKNLNSLKRFTYVLSTNISHKMHLKMKCFKSIEAGIVDRKSGLSEQNSKRLFIIQLILRQTC